MRMVVTRDSYFTAAYALLAERGHSALKIGTLCTSVGVTAGSFYNYFGSWDGFVEQLMDDWETERTDRVVEAVRTHLTPLARLQALRTFALHLPHGAEAAIRAWSHVHPLVRQAQDRVDAVRLSTVENAIGELMHDTQRSHHLAVLVISSLIGFQQWQGPAADGDLAAVLDEVLDLVLPAAG